MHQSKKKMYDAVEFHAMYGVLELWNSGKALVPGSDLFDEYVTNVAKRAVDSLKGKFVSVRDMNTLSSKALREAAARPYQRRS